MPIRTCARARACALVRTTAAVLQHGSADGRRAAAHGLSAVRGGTPREVLGLTGHAEAAVRIHALHAIGAADSPHCQRSLAARPVHRGRARCMREQTHAWMPLRRLACEAMQSAAPIGSAVVQARPRSRRLSCWPSAATLQRAPLGHAANERTARLRQRAAYNLRACMSIRTASSIQHNPHDIQRHSGLLFCLRAAPARPSVPSRALYVWTEHPRLCAHSGSICEFAPHSSCSQPLSPAPHRDG